MIFKLSARALLALVLLSLLIQKTRSHGCHRHLHNVREIDVLDVTDHNPISRRHIVNASLTPQIIFSNQIHQTKPSHLIERARQSFNQASRFLTILGNPVEHSWVPRCGYPEHTNDTTPLDFHGHIAIFVYMASPDDDVCRTEVNRTIAYSHNCAMDKTTHRPITGFVVVCPTFWEFTVPKQDGIWKHEFLHDIGFASDWFKFYPSTSLVKDPGFYTPNKGGLLFRESGGWFPIETRKKKYWHYGPEDPWLKRRSKKMQRGVFSPTHLGVLKGTQLVRDFFKCPVPGVPMSEDGNHLDNLYFYDDYMTPIEHGSSNWNSLLVYTILSESGWYGLQHEDELKMGDWLRGGVGCSVFEMNCHDIWLEERHGEPHECIRREKRSWLNAQAWNPAAPKSKCLERRISQTTNFFAEQYFCFDTIKEEDENGKTVVRPAKNCEAGVSGIALDPRFQYFRDHPGYGGLLGEAMEWCVVNKNWRTQGPNLIETVDIYKKITTL